MPNQSNKCRSIFSWATRLACLCFAVLAGISIPHALSFSKDQVVVQGNTVTMPVLLCKPGNLQVAGSMVSFDAANNSGCHTLSFLASACAMSLVFSMAAIVIFGMATVFSYRRRVGKSTISGAVAGMGFFLSFMLAQTAVCLWALGREGNFWESFYKEVMADVDSGINVKLHGNSNVLIATGAFGLIAALFLIVETLLMYCLRSDSEDLEEVKLTELGVVNVNKSSSFGATEDASNLTPNTNESGKASLGSSPKSGPAWSAV